MALNISSGLKKRLMSNASFAEAMNGGVALLYTGAQPPTADHAATGVLIGRVTRGGLAWTPGSPENGLRYSLAGIYALPDEDEVWRLKGLANGPVGWCRIVGNAYDSGAASVDLPRIDMTFYPLAEPRAGIILPSENITVSTDRVVDGFRFNL